MLISFDVMHLQLVEASVPHLNCFSSGLESNRGRYVKRAFLKGQRQNMNLKGLLRTFLKGLLKAF
jgi:hypothetical protein